MLRAPPDHGFDWHLDPTERAAAIVPMLDWMPAELVMMDARPTWLTQGMLTIAEFPLATRAGWSGQQVAGATPVLLCIVDVATGETHFYADPAADSLGIAWARFIGPLIASAAALPTAVRGALTYDYTWFRSQLSVLEGPSWNAGRVPRQLSGPLAPAPVWVTASVPGRQAVLEDAGRGDVVTVATAYRVGGMPQLRIDRREPDGNLAGNRGALRQAWGRMPVFTHLADSLTAAGDSISLRSVRWYVATATTAAWRPVFALPRRGAPALLWISTAIGDRTGGGRIPPFAWTATAAPDDRAGDHGPDAAAALDLARQWMLRADSAFRRGDMTAFGRAYEELRRTLVRHP